MKKYLLALLALALSSVSMAQVDSLYSGPKKLNESCAFNFVGGCVNAFDAPAMPAYGFSFSIYHFYADFVFKVAGHTGDTDVKVWRNEKKNWNTHFGYRLGVGRCGVTPVVGLSSYSVGDVDGYDWTYDHGIQNKFITRDRSTRFDYGIVLDYHLSSASQGCKVVAELTRYNLFAGLGLYF